ncbi:MAG: DNA polymerase III subunit beta [Chloroflexi bacterium]|nr:DNA polymerase III subunit beta [Chloroflexota bacterium]
MDFTVDQSSFARALRLVGRAVPAKPVVPILQAVLLECEYGRLNLASTDVEIGVSTSVAAEIASPGRAAIPARLLAEYVGQLPAEPLRLSVSGRDRAKVSCGRFTANLAGLDPDEFPVFPAADESGVIDIDAGQLGRAIERVAFAAARDNSRPILTSVLFAFGPEGLTLAAADGLRLARVRIPEMAGSVHQLLVPGRSVLEGGRLLQGAEAVRLILTHDGRGIYFATRDTRLFSRLVEGQYPNIDRVIPEGWRTRVRTSAADLRQAVRVAGLFGGGEARPVLLDAARGKLTLLAKGDDTGDARSELAAELEGDPGAVALDTRLLSDLLEAPDGPELLLSWNSPQTPVVVRGAGNAEGADLWVIMPIWDRALAGRQAEAA